MMKNQLLEKMFSRIKPSGQSRASTLNEIIIATALERKTLYWRIDKKGKLSSLGEDRPIGETILYFGNVEYRMPTKTVPWVKAKSLIARRAFMESSTEPLRIVNTSRKLGVVYGVKASLADGYDDAVPNVKSGYVISGMQAIDLLVKKQGKSAPFLAGFYFEGSGQTLAILVGTRSVQGDNEDHAENAHAIECLVNPGSLEELRTRGIQNFCVAFKFTLADEDPPLIFGASDLFPIIQDISPYPTEKEIYGIRASLLLKVLTGLGIAAALSCSAWAGYHVWDNQKQKDILSEQEERNTALQNAISKLMDNNPVSVAKALSINETQVFEQAESIWKPGTRISIDAVPSLTKYVLSLKLSHPTVIDMGRPSVFSVSEEGAVHQLLTLKPGKSCMTNQLKTNGDMSEIRVNINCKVSDSPLHRYID